MAEQDDQLARLYDENAVIRVTTKLARAQDDRDFIAYRSCFEDEVVMSQPLVQGWEATRVKADDWVGIVTEVFAKFSVTHHQLTNHVVDIRGDEAFCDVDINALHQVKTSEGIATATVGGRYSLKLRRHGSTWRIFERSLDVRYRAGDAIVLKIFGGAA